MSPVQIDRVKWYHADLSLILIKDVGNYAGAGVYITMPHSNAMYPSLSGAYCEVRLLFSLYLYHTETLFLFCSIGAGFVKQKPVRTTIKGGRKATSSIYIVIALVFGITVAAAAIAFFSAGYLVDKTMESAGVSVQINIYGDDIVVDIVGGTRCNDLQYVVLIIDGYTLPTSVSSKPVSVGQKSFVYDSLAYGMSGTRAIGVRGNFADGSTHLLAQKSFTFT